MVIIVARNRVSPEERRTQLIETARRLFETNGVQATSVSDIVKAAGVAQGTFYWYFQSKDEALEAVVQAYTDGICERVNALAHAPEIPALDKLARMRDLLLAALTQGGEPLEHIHGREHGEFHERMVDRLIERLEPAMAEVIGQGVAEGVFTTPYPEEAASLALATVRAIKEELFSRGGAAAAQKWVEAHLDFILRGLGVK